MEKIENLYDTEFPEIEQLEGQSLSIRFTHHSSCITCLYSADKGTEHSSQTPSGNEDMETESERGNSSTRARGRTMREVEEEGEYQELDRGGEEESRWRETMSQRVKRKVRMGEEEEEEEGEEEVGQELGRVKWEV